MKFDLCVIDWTAIAAILSFIMICITLYVLKKQLEQNQTENNKNRELQIKNIEHNTRYNQLMCFKQCCTEYLHLIDTVHIRHVGNLLAQNEDKMIAFNELREHFTKASLINTRINLSVPDSYVDWIKMQDYQIDDFLEYGNLFMDIQTFLLYIINGDSKIDPDTLKYGKSKEYICNATSAEGKTDIMKMFDCYVNDVRKIHDFATEKLNSYLKYEEKLINANLLDELE